MLILSYFFIILNVGKDHLASAKLRFSRLKNNYSVQLKLSNRHDTKGGHLRSELTVETSMFDQYA